VSRLDEYHEALIVLSMGIASRSGKTATDKPNGVHTVRNQIADHLVRDGLATDVPAWNAVEITDKGRQYLVTGGART
jgi:hypothetical protein